MKQEEKHATALKDIANILEDFDFTVAEKVGILSVLQTSYVLSAGGVNK